MTEQDRAINYKEYLERRTENLGRRVEHDKSKQEISKRFDQAMLTLTAGALALSVTFVKEIAPHPWGDTVPLLYIAWSSFALAIGLVLGAYMTSLKAIEASIRLVDIDIAADSRDLVGDTSELPLPLNPPHFLLAKLLFLKGKNQWGSLVRRCNQLSVLTFGAGVLFLLLFSASNLPEPPKMPDDKSKRPQAENLVKPAKDVEIRSLDPTGQPPRRPDPPRSSEAIEKKGS